MEEYLDSLGTLLGDFWRENRKERLEQIEFYDLVKINYKEYIKSPQWKAKAKKLKEKYDNRCQLCDAKGNGKTLHAHHRNYSTLGFEENDVIVLCKKCHADFHNKRK